MVPLRSTMQCTGAAGTEGPRSDARIGVEVTRMGGGTGCAQSPDMMQVCASAAVGEQAIRFWSQQKFGSRWLRIVKHKRTANAGLSQLADGNDWPLTTTLSPTTLILIQT